jgi:HAD superfamily hydrolase (TIGR01484 family)
MKRLYIFDLDNTLTESRTLIDHETAELLCELMKTSHVGVISGAAFWQFEKQLLSGIKCVEYFKNLTILTTSGAEMWSYRGTWEKMYSHIIPDDIRRRAISLVASTAGVTRGEESLYIEDRGSGITYSALGVTAPPEKKKLWDKDQNKRRAIVEKIATQLPELSIRIGGTTSIDFTLLGIDKAYGVSELAKRLGIPLSECVFVGDALYPGGNDSAVERLGIDMVKTKGPEETRRILKSFIS